MTDTIIDFIRHGEPIGGRAYRGHNIDDPLSEKGWQQMWDAVGEHCFWSHIVSSPLLRCLDFARALADKHDLSISIDERLKEVGFGEWEGKTPDQIKQQRLTEYNAFYADPVNKRPPGAEDLDSFIHRVTRAYQDIADYYTGKQILVVAHAGVMRAIIAHVLHAEPLGLYRIKVNNAGITRIRISERGAMLEYHNHCLK
jgi:probable phosphoglycerate mutase